MEIFIKSILKIKHNPNQMKTYILLIFASSIIGFSSCNTGNPTVQIGQFTAKDSASFTKVKWLDSIVDFGSMQMGETKSVRFRLLNIGDKPLFITNVKAGCGCTVPDYTKGAIPPGGEGMVTGSFDSKKSQPGVVHKSIYVTTNTPNGMNQTLIFTGTIEGHKASPETPVTPVKPVN